MVVAFYSPATAASGYDRHMMITRKPRESMLVRRRRYRRTAPLLAIAAACLSRYPPPAPAQNAAEPGTLAAVAPGGLHDSARRAALASHVRGIQAERRRLAVEHARPRGLPVRQELPDGGVRELVDWADGQPLYHVTLNANAAISTASDRILLPPYQAQGYGGTIGIWDAGSVRATHQEFGGRVTIRDGAAPDDHSTHVGGTLGATGIVASARGMAPQVRIDSYDWNYDLSEMTARGAAVSGETGKIYVSNHSYAMASGWSYSGTPTWTWYGTGTTADGYEDDFGRYNTYARDVDALAYGAPYYTIFWAAGNDRNNNPAAGASVALSPGGETVSYSASAHPPGDGVYHGGYETMGYDALGKNVITVGAVTDAVGSGVRDPSKASMTSFSNWGPTDDGRIKPDLVANGYNLYSTLADGDASYGTISGTSMAAPNAAGTAQQLVGLHADRLGGRHPRAATLKGLLIHTADDLGSPGPDYVFGWGLIDGREAADLIVETATNAYCPRLVEDALTTSVPVRTHRFTWDGVSPIRVTLCWTDPAGEATTTHDLRAPRLVNDLNLKVVGPDGREYFPYVMPFVGTWTTAAMSSTAVTGTNTTDNVEQVFMPAPPSPGLYRAVISCSGALANGQQAYSLIATGVVAPPPEPLSVTPDEGHAGPTALTVAGRGFAPGSTVVFFREGCPEQAARVDSIETAAIDCTLDVTPMALGAWSLRVVNADGRGGELSGAFTVVSALARYPFDPGAPGWTASAESGTSYWVLTNSASHTPSNAWFAPGPAVRNLDSLYSPGIAVPSRASGLRLRFWHRYTTEVYDGCVLELSSDNGTTWYDVEASGSGATFVAGGYTSTIKTRAGSDKKWALLAGRAAWTGDSGASFAETVVALDAASFAGQVFRARWRLSTDAQTASTGWWVDSVSLTGRLPPPTMLIVR